MNESTDPVTYRCDLCDYSTTYKSNFTKHMTSTRHKRNEGEIIPNKTYDCSYCNYVTNQKSHYLDHIASKAHEYKKNVAEKGIKSNQCICCLREFNSKTSLWRHKNHCKPEDHPVNSGVNESENNKTTANDAVIDVLVKQNDELRNMFVSQQNLVVSQHQQMATIVNTLVTNGISNNTNNSHNTNLTNTNNSHNTTNNQTFNINYFLNEHCKNAMNIDEFAKMLNCNAKDIEENRQLSFTEHVTKHLMDGIEKCTVETRPIHCSDAKREKMHVKTSEGWVSGKESEIIIRRIVALIDKMIWDAAREWAIANPSCMNLDTVAFNKYIEIKQSIIGPSTDAQEDKFMKKVMKALAEVTIIDKEHFSS